METIQLKNSILGWMLLPISQNSKSLLSEMYCRDYESAKPSERSFMRGEPIDKAIAHIKEVCKDMKIGVSFCGKKGGPTIRLWPPPYKPVLELEKASVDLKWSCWTIDEGIWDDYAPGVWQRMHDAWQGTAAPIAVSTGPRKEIRYGYVVIRKGCASGYFCTEWDSVEELADTLKTEADDAFNEMIPYSVHNMEPGLDWEFKVKARSFRKLMERIDKNEDDLIEHDKREWSYIEACFK